MRRRDARASLPAPSPRSRSEVNSEVSRLLASGPKDVIVLILRALLRAIPFAVPQLRDEFILDRLLELNARIVDAAAAGTAAMRDIAESFGVAVGAVKGGGEGGQQQELHAAAKDAIVKARRAAMQVRGTDGLHAAAALAAPALNHRAAAVPSTPL